MKMLPGFQRNRQKRGVFAVSSLLLLLATQTVAQSGRRAPKPTQPPAAPQTEPQGLIPEPVFIEAWPEEIPQPKAA